MQTSPPQFKAEPWSFGCRVQGRGMASKLAHTLYRQAHPWSTQRWEAGGTCLEVLGVAGDLVGLFAALVALHALVQVQRKAEVHDGLRPARARAWSRHPYQYKCWHAQPGGTSSGHNQGGGRGATRLMQTSFLKHKPTYVHGRADCPRCWISRLRHLPAVEGQLGLVRQLLVDDAQHL